MQEPRHPGIQISHLSHQPRAGRQDPPFRRSRPGLGRPGFPSDRKASKFRKTGASKHRSLKQKKNKENRGRKSHSKGEDNKHIKFDSKGYGRSLRNSYYLMHHKQMFYQTLMKDNQEHEQRRSFDASTDQQMDSVYKGAQMAEAERDVYKRGMTSPTQGRVKRKQDTRVCMGRAPPSSQKPPHMSLSIINSELKNSLNRKKKQAGCPDQEFKDQLDRKLMTRDARENQMVSNITVGIIRREIEKNLRELRKTKMRLVEVEGGRDFRSTDPKSSLPTTFETNEDVGSSKLMSLNRDLKRPPTRIHQDHEVLLLRKAEDSIGQKEFLTEREYLNEVLSKPKPRAPDSQGAALKMDDMVQSLQQNPIFQADTRAEEASNIEKMNQKVEEKTLIRDILGNVGKSHLAEQFFDGPKDLKKQDAGALARELFQSIKIKNKFEQSNKSKEPFFKSYPTESDSGKLLDADTMGQTLKIGTLPKSHFGTSLNVSRTRDTMNRYLNSVLGGGNFPVAEVQPQPVSQEKTDVFNYLQTLQNTFDLKNNFERAKGQSSGREPGFL